MTAFLSRWKKLSIIEPGYLADSTELADSRRGRPKILDIQLGHMEAEECSVGKDLDSHCQDWMSKAALNHMQDAPVRMDWRKQDGDERWKLATLRFLMAQEDEPLLSGVIRNLLCYQSGQAHDRSL
jgi:hypothetical protein